jgi:peptidoglycan/xylan/chitin deacetylase (PgdA/CDA1 family)
MRTVGKFFFVLICLFLASAIFFLIKNFSENSFFLGISQKVATESAFGSSVREAQKRAEEEKRKKEEEERKRIEEEKIFIATYGPCEHIPILMYHHIGDQASWLYVDPNTFASQMDYLIGKGYSTVTLSDVVDHFASGKNLGANPVVLTFDDGYRDFYSQAYPILRQKNLKATVFLITQLMEGADYLTWEEARELAGNPLITIGDHSLSHRSLASLNEEDIKSEVLSSRDILQSQLHIPINVFSYPYGSSNQTVTKYLQEGGFVAAVTSSSGYSCAKLPLALRRIRIGRTPLSSYGF